jgi:hypothetical protein
MRAAGGDDGMGVRARAGGDNDGAIDAMMMVLMAVIVVMTTVTCFTATLRLFPTILSYDLTSGIHLGVYHA